MVHSVGADGRIGGGVSSWVGGLQLRHYKDIDFTAHREELKKKKSKRDE